MEKNLVIEKYFWAFFMAGILLGLTYPVFNVFLMSLLKPFLMVMLFFVFLKIDVAQVFKRMKNYRQMIFLVISFMVVIPLLLFGITNIFDRELAISVLLLTAMPAGVATPALTDVVKGNTALSASLAILTSLVAPFTIPLLFRIINFDNISFDLGLVFKDLALIVFLPMVLSQVIKRYSPKEIEKRTHLFTSLNILMLSLMVYVVIGSQRNIIFNDFMNILWQAGFLYVVFILLHILGFLAGHKKNLEDKVAISVSAAYMNNSMAIVLASIYFNPTVLILMILSEFPWNTLLIIFRRFIQFHQQKQ
ncbi:hypothetical protein D1164_00815 [Mariniphaga sediminis]|uniref:Bile acid:sodium symporter family protein n=1 Tax=Mariniphaga sediminis TaxID=1628158 RepID=A0A399D602_9BACT|nr:bile acid:sodium symporter [Mariniphaga sediminis]RIH67007.1 hypothetical protein D1164_00815 [Mariniphaga sediminis]